MNGIFGFIEFNQKSDMSEFAPIIKPREKQKDKNVTVS